MPSRVPFDKYEAAILLDAYLRFEHGDMSRKDAVKSVSDELRQRASDMGEEVDDTFRTVAGIQTQMSVMEYNYTGGKKGNKKLTKIFIEIIDLYRNNREEYDKLLHEARSMTPDSCQQLPLNVLSPNLRTSEVINHIKSYVASCGFTYPDGMIENLYLSLKSKPFVILAGISGTGKTRIAKLFAEAIGAAYKIVPVRPDWSDSSDLFGYTDLNGHFVHGAIFDFVHEAKCNPQKPYILCLDEMNLARVEYYLSDFLSILETREMKDGKIQSAPLFAKEKYGSDQMSAEKYGELFFPENLYLIGTVNMDETTFPFSKKVLDRANTIEFSDVDLNPSFLEAERDTEPQSLPNSFLRSDYLILKQCAGEAEYVVSICSELQKLNDVLKKANLHVGYRVRDEIVFYMLNNREAEGLLTEDEAMDFEIMQKILPRIQGSSAAVKDVLCGLFQICAADLTQFTGDRDSEKMEKARKQVQCRYPKSAEKLELMTRRFEEDGFTSYWL